MRLGLVLVALAYAVGCGKAPSAPDSSPEAADGVVIAHLALWLDQVQPPVKVAEAWLIRTENGKRVQFDSSWWESVFRQDPAGPLMELEHAEGLSWFFRDSPGWKVSPFSNETIYVDLHPHMVDHNLIVQLHRNGPSSWGIATDFGDTELGTVELISIEWDELDD